jgi:hypothetical protein
MIQTMFEAVAKLMCKMATGCNESDLATVKPSKWRRTKTIKLCKSISDSSGRLWAKNWYTFISNLDYEILQWNGSAPKKKIARVSPCFLHLKFLKRAFLGDMKQWWSRH